MNYGIPKTLLVQDKIEKAIINKARKKKQVVYGARSIQAQIGLFSRPTMDFDIFTSNPKGCAYSIQNELDKIVGKDYYYAKSAKHPGTYKVMNKGKDMKKGTEDDEGIIDYTKMPKPKPKVKNINGVSYRHIKEEIKAKNTALRDKEFTFRHGKDSEDLKRINLSGYNHKNKLLY